MCPEGRLPFISWANSNLMIPTSQINLGKHLCTTKQSSMSSNLGMGKRYLIVILLIALLSTHPPRAILLRSQESRNRTRANTSLNVASIKKLLNLFLQLFLLLWSHMICCLVWKGCTRYQINDMLNVSHRRQIRR